MVMSTGTAPVLSTSRKRTPLATGSTVGVSGTEVKKPLKLSLSSPAGARSLVRVSFALSWPVGTMLVHGSQASPRRSPSALACEVLGIAWQLSMASHTVSPSVSGNPESAGQAGLEPVQLSARSHVLAEGRHTVPEGANASGGQVLLTPLQLSATSQRPATPRQTAVLFASGGQAWPAVPEQLSAGSQSPAEARHCVPLGATTSAGQA